MITVNVWWIPLAILAAAFIGCIVIAQSDKGSGDYFGLPGERFFFGCLGTIACVVLMLVVVALWGWLR